MPGDYVSNAGVFVVDTVIGLYTLVVLLRFLFQLTRADYYNPISQLVVRLSNPPLVQLRRLIPSLGGIDTAAIVLLLGLEICRIGLITLLLGHTPRIAGLVMRGIGELLKLTVYVFVFSIFIRAVLSWFSTSGHNPMLKLIYTFTEPLLRKSRQLLPATGGLDLSPILIFLALMMVLKLFVQPLLDYGRMAL